MMNKNTGKEVADMTQSELEQLAKQVRSTGLHASWLDLMGLVENVVGNLVEAYKIVIVNNQSFGRDTSAGSAGNSFILLQEKLGVALTALTSPEQVSRWEEEAYSKLLSVDRNNNKRELKKDAYRIWSRRIHCQKGR
jgi:hypothetical protein